MNEIVNEHPFFALLALVALIILGFISWKKGKKLAAQIQVLAAQNYVFSRVSRIQSDDKQHPAVGPVIYYGNSNHNASDVEFQFRYAYKNGSWRAYIIYQPSYKGRNDARTVTHRYYDSNERAHYVCWDTPIEELKDIQIVSKFWADCTLEYIATGERFGPN